MRTTQYKINVHVASVLSNLGLLARAEEPFYVAKRKRIPDFVLNHNIAGAMIGEAEVGNTELDHNAIERLKKRVYERFSDIAFKGYDFIMLLIYPHKLVEEIASLPEAKIEKELMEKTVGLGIAVRGNAFQLERHYIRWYSEPVKVINIPQTLDVLTNEFFKRLKERNPNIKVSAHELIRSINTIIENTSRNLSLIRDSSFIEKLANVAFKLNIAWDQIKKLEDKISITTKFIMLMSALVMIFYEIVRNERLHDLESLKCDTLNTFNLVKHFEELVIDKRTNTLRYAELNAGFIEVLKDIPAHVQMDNALRNLCVEIKNNYVLIRRMGWDILSMLYQRLLSETYRHAFATFYTKLPAARLLASLAIEKFSDEVIDPACGTGSLLLASLERRRMLLGGEVLRKLYKESIESERPLLDIANEIILTRTTSLDALKPACFIAALNLRIATQGSPPNGLSIYNVPVGVDRAGSLDLLTAKKSALSKEVQSLCTKKHDVVIMNPPFTRSDRISFLIGEDARKQLSSAQLYFGRTKVSQIFEAGMAKPFMVLADRLVKVGGRIAAVLPNSVLSRPSWKDVRKELLNNYNIEYIAISWASGTPNFSSDTRFREILLVARKRDFSETTKSLKILNLYKKVDCLTSDEIEKIVRSASAAENNIVHIISNDNIIASIVTVNLEAEIKKRLKSMGYEGITLKKKIKEELERLSDNLYRFIAFRSSELLKMHLDLVIKCSIRFSDVFSVGSVVDHTSGLTKPAKRNENIMLPHEIPALWGSGKSLNIEIPWLGRAPFKIGVADGTSVKVRYWKQPSKSRTFYSAKVFIPRKVRLSTQYVLMIYIDEDSISNVWWPLRPKDYSYVIPYLIYMNSTFGFLNLLGERLETEGLYMEIKKQHLKNMPVPDLRRVSSSVDMGKIAKTLKGSMPRFDQYIEFMARRNKKMNWYDTAQSVIEEARKNIELQPYANRAMLDLEVYRMLCEVCHNMYIPNNLYSLLKEDVSALQQIMEHDEPDRDVIEDVAKRVEKKAKSVPLDKWDRRRMHSNKVS